MSTTLPAPGATLPGDATPSILDVSNLSMHFPGRRGKPIRAVDDVSFSIRPGETLGLVGESGCGKSTLVRSILGLHKPTAGSVKLGGDELVHLSDGARRKYRSRMQVVFQDPSTSLNADMTVHDVIAEPLRINRRYDQARVHELLDQVGLPREALTKKPSEFSGGQRQRIGIARALALKPELLILDEPVSALDVSIQAQVINLLAELQRELGLAYLFIAHDLSVVRHVSHRVAVMYLGRLVEIGSREQVFDSPEHPYTKALLSAIPLPEPRGRAERSRTLLTGDLPSPANPPAGCPFHTRCPVARDVCSVETPRPSNSERAAACLFAPEDLFVRAS
ncbi:ABC transporter ATP-binding protein [Frondihabitans cladoniiphilus]|uniref:Dipeptide ABC transporter ATP-binding protein n=1 Tax=Frondihabitans cladoniiphilus TaxID=715785 RepID=A0ABP8W619_9MICO